MQVKQHEIKKHFNHCTNCIDFAAKLFVTLIQLIKILRLFKIILSLFDFLFYKLINNIFVYFTFSVLTVS